MFFRHLPLWMGMIVFFLILSFMNASAGPVIVVAFAAVVRIILRDLVPVSLYLPSL